MTPLIWSEDKPKVEGKFWYRERSNYEASIEDVYEADWFPNGIESKCLYVSFDGECAYRMDQPETNGQWSGPIPLPIEPDQPHYIDRAVSTDLNERVKQ